MSTSFATVQDVETLWRPLSAEEQSRAAALLPLVSDALREEAKKVGMDLDAMVTADPALGSVAKIVTVDVTARVLRQSTTGDAVSQESQSALGYSWSGTYAVPGGGIAAAIMQTDLKRLGILRQRIKAVKLWDGTSAACPSGST